MARILLVDDEAEFCNAFREFLVRRKHTVFIANHGTRALEILREERPDALVIDIRMPGMDGREVLKKARETDKNSVILVVTAIGDAGLKKEIMELGATGLLQKPVNLLEVCKLIEDKIG